MPYLDLGLVRGPAGADGRGIVSITRTSGTGAPGTVDTYTITFTDSTTTTFQIYNGADGQGAVLSVNGQTGAVTLDADDIDDSSTTNKFVTATEKSTWNGKADGSHSHSDYMPKSGGTFTGQVVAQNNTSYTTAQVRNIILSTSDPSGGNNGDIWIKYST
jgi:hypothetical protein